MKNKKLMYIVIAILSLVTITITGFVLAEKSANRSYEELDRTAVVLQPKTDANGNYTGEVEVLLQMNDGIRTEEQKPNEEGTIIEDAASVQSFQIGLDVAATIENKEDVSFTFNKELAENAENDTAGKVKLAKVTQELVKDEQSSSEGNTTIYKGEKLNIYYVGTKDLNDTNSVEMVSIGTLKIKVPEGSTNETVMINPIEEATTASSTGHSETKINVQPEDKVSFILNEKESDHEDDPSGNTNTNTGGSTNTNTEGNTNTNTEGSTNTNTEGSGNTNTGGNTNTNTGSGSGTGGTGSQGSGTGSQGGSGGSSTGGTNNGWSAKDEDKAKGNIGDKIISALKTGANHSITWIIIAIVVLAGVAFGIVMVKTRASGKRAKH